MRAPALLVPWLLIPLAARAFDPQEHKWAGDRGSALALKSFPAGLKLPWGEEVSSYKQASGCPAPSLSLRLACGEAPPAKCVLSRSTVGDPPLVILTGARSDSSWFTFGDLVATYGDFRLSMAELADTHPSEYRALRRIMCTGDFHAVGREGRRFLSNATTNKTHFSDEAVSWYARWHRQALEIFAREGARGGTPRPDELRKAMHSEAIAVHSLTDLFAPGHMFVERVAASTKVGSSNLVVKIVGVAEGVGHSVAHDGFNEHGATVKSLARPSPYKAYGDGKLHGDPENQAQVQEIVEAVRLSVASLGQAFEASSPPRVLAARKTTAPAKGKPVKLDGCYFRALAHVPVEYSEACTHQIGLAKVGGAGKLCLPRGGGWNRALYHERVRSLTRCDR